MSKFTSSERRGAIVILAIIACITIFLAISKGVGLKAPEAIPQQNAVTTVSDSSSTDEGSRGHKKKNKSKSSERKTKKSGKKKAEKHSDNSKPRDPLSEPVSK